MRANATIAVAALLLVSTTVAVPVLGGSGGGKVAAPGAEDATQDPPDPESDVLGWENGYWYNESLGVAQGDGLNDTERRKVVSLAMARVEHLRKLEFRTRVPVKVTPRAKFQQARQSGKTPAARRTFDNAKFEALFLVNESTDSIAVQERNSGSSVGGFYSPRNDAITVISDAPGSPRIDELTLAHELVHALQDQHFDLSEFERPTREQHNAIDGLVEGDANYVQYLYTQQCNDDWTCYRPQKGRPGGGSGDLANLGAYLLKFQPYSDGPPFVKSVRDAKGWKGVNALYEDPPASTEQIIHPELYGEDRPARVAIEDRSSEAWNRLTVKQRPNYAELGEAGLFTMLVYPGLASKGKRSVVPPRQFVNRNPGSNETSLDPYNYSHPATAGWDGDRLAVYVNDDAPPNETGYVWKTAWDSKKDARQFARAYRKLLKLHGAHRVDGRANTWVIPDDREFADAFYVERRGDSVVVVNAPTVDQLPGVYGGVAFNSS